MPENLGWGLKNICNHLSNCGISPAQETFYEIDWSEHNWAVVLS